jgi:3-hydroxyisobutyrate dehydrogenase-like beta-hydroxyacid dehydrogenase
MVIRVGMLGVGRMGLPIARRLVSAGFDVSAWDPAEPSLRRAASAGVTVEESAAGVAASAEILLTVLPGTPEVKNVMTGAGAALGALRPGSLWLDLTSSDPRVAEQIAEFAAARGIDSVGAAMGGGVSAAEAGSLHFFVGGRAIERARPVLEALGSVEVIGDAVGAGHTAKLLANLLWFGQVVAVTEALLLGQALGLAPAGLRDTLAASAGGSVFIDEYLDRLLDGDYLETFGIDRVVEELDTLASLAQGAGVPFELSSTVARLHREALERFGAVDGELLAAKLLEQRYGTELRR